MGGGSAYGNAIQVKKSEGRLIFGGGEWSMQNASRNIIQIRAYLAGVKESHEGVLLIPGCYPPDESASVNGVDEDHEAPHQKSDFDAVRETFAKNILVSSTLQASCPPIASVAPEDSVTPLEQLYICIHGTVPVGDASVFYKRYNRNTPSTINRKRPNVSGPLDVEKKRVRFM